MYEFNGCGCRRIKWIHAGLVSRHVCYTYMDTLPLYVSVDTIILSCPWFTTENCYKIPSITLYSCTETDEACHSFLWIKMDNIMRVSLQPCYVVVIFTWSPMYDTPEKYPCDPMREVSFSHSHKSCIILRIWNHSAGQMENQSATGYKRKTY